MKIYFHRNSGKQNPQMQYNLFALQFLSFSVTFSIELMHFSFIPDMILFW